MRTVKHKGMNRWLALCLALVMLATNFQFAIAVGDELSEEPLEIETTLLDDGTAPEGTQDGTVPEESLNNAPPRGCPERHNA